MPASGAPNEANAAKMANEFSASALMKIDILRKAWLGVEDNGIPANYQISNAMGMECGQKVFVILEHPARSPIP